jgi:hypothetical protein
MKPPAIAALLALRVFGLIKTVFSSEIDEDTFDFRLKGQALMLIKNGRILYSYY